MPHTVYTIPYLAFLTKQGVQEKTLQEALEQMTNWQSHLCEI